jgi:uncharacterized membrane protein (UPF0127 family)
MKPICLPMRAAAAALALAAAAVHAQGVPQPTLPKVMLKAGMHVIAAEVAQSPAQQETGMMFRRSVEKNDGMLFVNDAPALRCFWMHNTLVPLSIAFIADDGTIVNIDEMKAQTDDSHCSLRPVRFALEMRAGWFREHAIQPGFRLGGSPFSK